CPCGSTHRRIERIYGRSDNMVKLRGTNLFPEAIGGIVGENRAANGEYVCIVERAAATGREEMTVWVEAADAAVSKPDLEKTLAARFKEALGVTLGVKAVERGGLDEMTGLSTASKVRRLIDKRHPEQA
ncbi:MAG: hypothetical protein HYU44_21390, partial [Betaproteobacteria bacterium]|nr:hypothetical protein [Betaproteobacteria bacterium]